jgi:hypothetical protein
MKTLVEHLVQRGVRTTRVKMADRVMIPPAGRMKVDFFSEERRNLDG